MLSPSRGRSIPSGGIAHRSTTRPSNLIVTSLPSRLLLGTLATLLALAGTAQASPLELYGFGARSAAFAGGGVATGDTFDCVYLNPAGLAKQRSRYVAGGVAMGRFDLRLDSQDTNLDDTIATTFGLVAPLPLAGSLKDRLTLGFGLMVPQKALARARAPEVGKPTFALLDSRSEIVGIQIALGYLINERWSVGAGVLALATLTGRIQVDVDGAGRFVTQSEQALKTHYAPNIGARYHDESSAFRYGLTVRAPSRASYDINIDNTLGETLPLSLPQLLISGVAQYDPLIVATEASYRPTQQWLLAAQLDYKRWSAFPSGTKNPIAHGEPIPSPGFHDTVTPRLSAEWTGRALSTSVATRAGYSFHFSPAPEMTGLHSLLDNHRHLIALGLGLSWPETDWPFHLDLWMQLHQLVPRTHTKDAARFDDPMDIPFESIRGSGRLAVGGFTLGVDL